MKRRIIAVPAACLALGALASCSDRAERAGEAGAKSQVLQESYTRQTQNLGRISERAGDVDVQGRREIVRKSTEEVRENVPTVVVGQTRADLNRMDTDDFRALGLSEQAARNTVQYREKHGGRFASVEDLRQVPGMDLQWLARYRDKLAISGQAAGQVGGD